MCTNKLFFFSFITFLQPTLAVPDNRMRVFGVIILFDRESSGNLSLQSTVYRLKPWCWETSLTLSFSCLLLLGPFHWTMVFPMSSRNTSPRLKLFQLISTWKTMQNEAPNPTLKWNIAGSHCAHLFGSHSFLSLNVEQSLHVIAVDFSVPHARRDPPFLEAKCGGHDFYGRCKILYLTVKFLYSTHIIPCLK